MTILFYSCFVHVNGGSNNNLPINMNTATFQLMNMENATAFISFASSLINLATLLINVSILFVMVTFFRNSLGTSPKTCSSVTRNEKNHDEDYSSLDATEGKDEDVDEDSSSSTSTTSEEEEFTDVEETDDYNKSNKEDENNFNDMPPLTRTIYNTRSKKNYN